MRGWTKGHPLRTYNGGWLGSHIDEERSKLRNVMRFAELVNHRIFERKWRSREILRACLFECPSKKTLNYLFFIRFNFDISRFPFIWFAEDGSCWVRPRSTSSSSRGHLKFSAPRVDYEIWIRSQHFLCFNCFSMDSTFMLFERSVEILLNLFFKWAARFNRGVVSSLLAFKTLEPVFIFHDSWICVFLNKHMFFWISNQTRQPAEFKHINKRRKRN